VIQIKGFWAYKHRKGCEDYTHGRDDVLKAFGFSSMVKSPTDWYSHKHVYLLVVYMNDLAVAGMRIDVKTQPHKLPLENALNNLCPNLADVLNQYKEGPYGEIGGVWNAKYLSNLQFSHILARYSLAVSPLLGMTSAFTFNASYTHKLSTNYGAVLIESIGSKGWFNYPSDRYKAGLFVFKNITSSKSIEDYYSDRILFLRKNLSAEGQTERESGDELINYYADL
jgi:hypothetical protein